MPIASFSKLARFSDTCGAEIPRWLRLKLQSYADDTASSNGIDKESSDTKWLFGGQIGADWKINRANTLKLAAAYYQFQDIEGERSSPCSPWAGQPGCDTDGSRVAFMQKGNSVFNLRNITPNPATPGTTPEPQYVGLASKFNVLDLNAVLAGAVPFLHLCGVVCGGWQMARAALAAQRKLAAGDSDAAFYRAKVATARFFADQDLSRARGLAEATMHAGASTMALAEEQF